MLGNVVAKNLAWVSWGHSRFGMSPCCQSWQEGKYVERRRWVALVQGLQESSLFRTAKPDCSAQTEIRIAQLSSMSAQFWWFFLARLPSLLLCTQCSQLFVFSRHFPACYPILGSVTEFLKWSTLNDWNAEFSCDFDELSSDKYSWLLTFTDFYWVWWGSAEL